MRQTTVSRSLCWNCFHFCCHPTKCRENSADSWFTVDGYLRKHHKYGSVSNWKRYPSWISTVSCTTEQEIRSPKKGYFKVYLIRTLPLWHGYLLLGNSITSGSVILYILFNLPSGSLWWNSFFSSISANQVISSPVSFPCIAPLFLK